MCFPILVDNFYASSFTGADCIKMCIALVPKARKTCRSAAWKKISRVFSHSEIGNCLVSTGVQKDVKNKCMSGSKVINSEIVVGWNPIFQSRIVFFLVQSLLELHLYGRMS